MSAHHHPHSHDRPHDHRLSSSRRTLLGAVVFTAGFACIEAVGGWVSGSLALISDAGHMVTDSLALAMGALAAWAAAQPPSTRHSFGWQRAEVMGAFINALAMVAVVVFIATEAVGRLRDPVPVNGGLVTLIAAIGLAINLAVFRLLHGGEQDLNVRAATLHVLGDLLGSVGALVAGLVVYWTGWNPIDPLLSLLICALLMASTLKLLLEVVHTLMEGVPHGIDLNRVGDSMTAVAGVQEIHDLHIWGLSSGNSYLSAHVVVDRLEDWPEVLSALNRLLCERQGVRHITLQPEPPSHRIRTPQDPYTAGHRGQCAAAEA